MLRTMFDSVTPRVAPRNCELFGYYLNGSYAVPSISYVTNLYPPPISLVPIDANATRADFARVLDVERFDATPAQCEQWLTDFKEKNPSYHNGGRGVIYTTRSSIPAVRIGTGKYVLGKDYYLWIATGDGTLFTGEGVIACQNYWHKTYDSSVVYSPEWLPNG
jgi:hypothetical protein